MCILVTDYLAILQCFCNEIALFLLPVQQKMSAGKAQIGKPAPDFTAKAVMPDGQFKDLKLSDYRGTTAYSHTVKYRKLWMLEQPFFFFSAGKYIVFFFYPLDFTFVCPTEIIAFSDAAEEFKKINCEVIGASVDSHFCHLAWWGFAILWSVFFLSFLKSHDSVRKIKCLTIA